MKKKGLIVITVTLGFAVLISGQVAAIFNEVVYVNGEAYMKTTYSDGKTELQEVVYINGTAYVNITIDAGGHRLTRLEDVVESMGDYIISKDADWSEDDEGVEEEDLVYLWEKLALYRGGEETDLSENEKRILGAIQAIIDFNMRDFLRFQVSKALQEYQKMIQNQQYDIESVSKVLRLDNSSALCKAKRDIMHKYDLTSVKCGENSQICYNGEKYSPYGDGSDFCIVMDEKKAVEKNSVQGSPKEKEIETTIGPEMPEKREPDQKSSNRSGICIPDWSCSDWGECVQGVRKSYCVDQNSCPDSERYMEFEKPCTACEIDIQCGEWSKCLNGTQKRICKDINNCGKNLNDLMARDCSSPSLKSRKTVESKNTVETGAELIWERFEPFFQDLF